MENEIISLYKEGKSIREIVKIKKSNRYRITKVLKDNNIKILSKIDKLRKYEINENYFDTIDSEHKAYTIGFLYADGYNFEKRNMVKIAVRKDDVDILEKIKYPICSTKPLRYYEYKNTKSNPQFSFVIDNSNISKRLSSLGVVQAKTFKLEFPKFLDEDLIRHFIRGYFDGDGCITQNYQKNYLKYQISFISTENFINGIQNHLNEKLNIKFHKLSIRFPERNNNIRSLMIGGNRQVEKILDYLYKNSNIYLNRKHEKYLKLKDHLKTEDGLSQ